MPDDKPDDRKADNKEPKDQKRREQVLVGAAVAGVILTVVLIRRSKAPAAVPQTAPQPGTPGGSAGSFSDGVSTTDFLSLQAQVNGLSTELSQLASGSSTGTPAPIGSSSPTPISDSGNTLRPGIHPLPAVFDPTRDGIPAMSSFGNTSVPINLLFPPGSIMGGSTGKVPMGGAAAYGQAPNGGGLQPIDVNGASPYPGFNYSPDHPFVPVPQRVPGASYNSAGQAI